MEDYDKLPTSVSARKSRSVRPPLPVMDDQEYNSDFDEFGDDVVAPAEKMSSTPERKDGVEGKSNKTRLGKLMSKAVSTIGSIAAISPKKPPASAETNSRSSYSAPVTPAKPPFSTSGFRNSTATTRPEIPRARPESLPLGRHSESLAARPVSVSARLSTHKDAPTSRLSGSKKHPSEEDDLGGTWREVGRSRSACNSNSNSNSDSEGAAQRKAADLISPTAVAHGFSVRLPAGYADPNTVRPVLEVHPSTSSASASSSSARASLGGTPVKPSTPALASPAPSSRHSLTHSQSAPLSASKPASSTPNTPASTSAISAKVAATPSPARTQMPVAAAEHAGTSHLMHATAAIDFPAVPTHQIKLSPGLKLATPEADDDTGFSSEDANYGVTSSAALPCNEISPVVAVPVQVDAKPLAIVRYLRLLVLYSPQPLSSFFAKLEPTVSRWASALHFIFLTLYIFLEIMLELAIELWVVLKPYRPELLFPSFAGLVMCFFGGSFVTTIAAAEAYRLVGYESTRECLKSLIEDFKQVLQAAERDAAMGVDDIEPSFDSTSTKITSKGADGAEDDVWSDWRTETETPRERTSSSAPALAPASAQKLYYSDGTESLGEVHHRANVSAQVYHVEEVPPTPRPHKTPVKAPAAAPMATRSSARLGKPLVESPAGAAGGTPATTGKRLIRKRRSMFDAHADGLEAFRTSMLEHRTPAKTRSSILPSSTSKSTAADASAASGAGLFDTISTGDSIGSETEHIPAASSAAPDAGAALVPPPTPMRMGKRGSLPGGQQTLQEYQREQEEQGADTTASKALFFLQNVDPQRFTTAIVGLNAGLVAVVATLKVQFAKTITLGTALSKAIDAPAKVFLLPLVQLALPKPYKKWADVLLTYSIKTFAVSIAWTLRRVVSSFHSAIRGGLMFSTNLLGYLSDMGVLGKYGLDGYIPYVDKILGYSIALLGLWFQLSYGFALPFPLNIILFPFTVLEYVLVWMVNNSHYIIGH